MKTGKIAKVIMSTAIMVSMLFGLLPDSKESARADTTVYDFEGGLQGWTTVDDDQDGHNWTQMEDFTSIYSYYIGIDLSDWVRSGTNSMLSGSYINDVGVLDVDNWLISPQVTLGGSMSFYALACDSSYPEYIGVYVSTTGTDPDDFTEVDSFSVYQRSWEQFTVDLSSYSGTGYVAIRNYNSYDNYLVSIDDISITAGLDTITCVVTGFEGQYDGNPHGVTVNVTDPASGATVRFGTSAGTYNLDESPTYTDVGTYTVYYSITATGYAEKTGSATINITDQVPSEPSSDPSSGEPSLTPEQLRLLSVQNFVENLYISVLGRQYDVTGRDAWVDLIMNHNGTATQVVRGFLNSPEYIGRQSSDAEFVTTLYKVFFNRTPSAAEVANWTNALANGATRDQVINGFAGSPEWAAACARIGINA